jgi:hypothetical protein
MLVRMHELIAMKSQFIIATHSPILMAYPEADIYQIDESGLVRTAYEETEHFLVTRRFWGIGGGSWRCCWNEPNIAQKLTRSNDLAQDLAKRIATTIHPVEDVLP